MKITILTQYYPPEMGAPQARLSSLASCLIQAGHEVTVLTAMPNYPTGKILPGYKGLLRKEDRDGARVLRTFIIPVQKADFLRRLTSYFSFVLSSTVAGALLLEKSDYLIVESPPLFLGFTGVVLSRMKKARLIFNVSDLWPESAVRMGVLDPASMAYRVSSKLESYCYRHSFLITGQSRSIVADIAARFPGSPTYHFSNGVDLARFDRAQTDENVRRQVRSDGSIVALYAGLHGLAQGLDQVLDAAEAMRGQDGFRFVFVGDGPKKSELVERSISGGIDNVNFMNPRPAEEIPSTLAASDIVLVTLKTHIPGAVPSKLYEAMASRRPVVLVAEGEAAEIVRTHKTGIVVRPGDTAALVRALETLSLYPGLRRTLGENGRRAAENFFDRKMIAARFIEYLEVNRLADQWAARGFETEPASEPVARARAAAGK